MIEDALIEWMKADAEIYRIKEVAKKLASDLQLAENEADKCRDNVAAYLAETGEFEVNIEGELQNYQIYYTTPRKSVKADSEATPDEFCKIERKPKLREIGEYIESLPEGEMPNWASFHTGEPKLSYRIKKK